MEKTQGAGEGICVWVGTGGMSLENLEWLPHFVSGGQKAWEAVPTQLCSVLPVALPFLNLRLLICIMGLYL